MKFDYERFKEACASRDTTISAVLNKIGRADSSTGNWKAGRWPRLDICIEIADYLDMTLDELVFGETEAKARANDLTADQIEWLSIIDRIPKDRQDMCKDFLRTHMTVPDVYEGKQTV